MKYYIEPDELWNYCMKNKDELLKKLVCVMENDFGLGVYVTQNSEEELSLVLMDEDEIELETFEFYTNWDLVGILEKLTLHLAMDEETSFNSFSEEEIREAFEEFIYRLYPSEDTITDEAYEAVYEAVIELLNYMKGGDYQSLI